MSQSVTVYWCMTSATLHEAHTHEKQPVEKEHGVDRCSLTLSLEQSGDVVSPHFLNVIIGDIGELSAHHCRSTSRWLQLHLWYQWHSGRNTYMHTHTTQTNTHTHTHTRTPHTHTHTHTRTEKQIVYCCNPQPCSSLLCRSCCIMHYSCKAPTQQWLYVHTPPAATG